MDMTKKALFIMLALFMVLLTACGGESTAPSNGDSNTSGGTGGASTDKKVTIKIAHVASEKSSYQDAVKHFADSATKLSEGSLEFKIYPGGQLGGDREMLESVQNGSLDAGYISLGIFEGLTPVFTGLQLPYLIDSYETGYKAATSETAKKALASLEKHNIKGLAIVDNGFRVLGNNVKPIKTPDDFKGLKLRSSESGLQLEMFKALGASPTPMPYPEIYSSLQTGVIDGQDQILVTWQTDKFGEVIKYLSLNKMYTWPAIFSMNKTKFDSLSDNQKKAIEQAATDAQKFIFDKLEKYDADALEALQKLGTIDISTDVDLKPFTDKVKPLIEQYSQKDPLVKEMVETIEKIKSGN